MQLLGRRYVQKMPSVLAYWAVNMLPTGANHASEVCTKNRGQAGRAERLEELHPE